MTEKDSFKSTELYILEKTGLNFAGNKHGTLKRVVQSRMKEHKIESEDSYLDLLRGSSMEEKLLFDLLTTNETHFFRNQNQFDYLMKVIIPALEEKRGVRPVQGAAAKIRVLCAGCSTGEEAYSVALSILFSLRYPLVWDLRIVAGDLSSACLSIAEKGYYPNEKVRAVPSPLLAKYSAREEGGIRFNAEIKKVISFVPLNLKAIMDGERVPESDSDGEAFDLIFCRNVMIYFPAMVQQRLVETLAHWLVPGGYLFTGDAEPLHLFSHDLMVMREAECLVYRKREKADANIIPQPR